MKIACAPLPDRAARTQQGTTHAAHLRLSVRAILFMNLIEMFWLTKEYVFWSWTPAICTAMLVALV